MIHDMFGLVTHIRQYRSQWNYIVVSIIWINFCMCIFSNVGDLSLTLTSWNVIFEVKLTSEMLTMRGQHHSCSTPEPMLLWKCQRFWDRKCLDLSGTRTLNHRINAECPYHSGPDIRCSMFLKTGSGGIDISNIGNINCALAKCLTFTSWNFC